MRLLVRLAPFILVAGLAACASEPTPTPTPSATPTATPQPTATPTPEPAPQTVASNPVEQSYLRFVHAAPDFPTVDIFIGQLALATNLSFRRYSDAAPIAAGSYPVRVVASGSGRDAAPLFETTLEPQGGQTQTVLLLKFGDSAILKPIPETVAPLHSDQSRVVLINAVSGAPELSLLAGGSLLASAFFGEASAPAVIPRGSTEVALRSGAAAMSAQTLQLRGQYSTILVAVGTPDEVALVRFESLMQSQARVRLINAARGIGSIAAYLDETTLSADIPYGRGSERMEVVAAPYTLNLYPAGVAPQDADPLFAAPVHPDADAVLSLILLGSAGDLSLVEYHDDLTATTPGEFRIAFMNGRSDHDLVRATIDADAIAGLPDLGFGQAPAAVTLPAGMYNFRWSDVLPDGETDTFDRSDGLVLEAGFSYLYLLTYREGDEPPFILGENVGVESGQPAVNLENAARVRLVNAVQDSAVSVSIGGTPVGGRAGAGESSLYVPLAPGQYSLTLDSAAGDDLPGTLEASFDEAGIYSLYAYRNANGLLTLMAVDDSGIILNDEAARVRLVNISPLPETLLGLASTGALPPDQRAPENPSEFADPTRRLTLPFGAQRYINNIPGGSASTAVAVTAGVYDVYLVDMLRFGIAQRVNDVTLEAGRLYDVIGSLTETSAGIAVIPAPPRTG